MRNLAALRNGAPEDHVGHAMHEHANGRFATLDAQRDLPVAALRLRAAPEPAERNRMDVDIVEDARPEPELPLPEEDITHSRL